jgi:hypothetical protein
MTDREIDGLLLEAFKASTEDGRVRQRFKGEGMNRDEIIRLARSAIRLSVDDTSLVGFDQEQTILDRYEFLYWFTKEVAAAEREAWAKRLEAIGCEYCAVNMRLREKE